MKRPTIPIEIKRGDASFTWHYCTGQVESLSFAATPSIRWIRGFFGMPYGMCYLDKREQVADGVKHVYEYMTDLKLTVTRTLTDEGLVERYTWQNAGKKDIAIQEGEVGVYVTFAEKYDVKEVTRAYRAYTEILAGGKTFYMYNTRCNGATDGVGLVLQEGRIAEVKAERLHPAERGDLVAYMPAVTLAPDETVNWQWLVYPYADESEFWQVARRYAHKINVTPLWPKAGQSVTVTVDDRTPDEVVVNGEKVANPFKSPEGTYTLQPVADEEETLLTMKGISLAERWADEYHGLRRGQKNNPRRYIAESSQMAARFAQSGEQGDYDAAVNALYAYYRTAGAYRQAQMGMPQVLIRSNEGLRKMFARHVDTILKPSRRRYTADTALGTYEMLRVADYVFDGKYAEEKQRAFEEATPKLFTPYGILYLDKETD